VNHGYWRSESPHLADRNSDPESEHNADLGEQPRIIRRGGPPDSNERCDDLTRKWVERDSVKLVNDLFLKLAELLGVLSPEVDVGKRNELDARRLQVEQLRSTPPPDPHGSTLAVFDKARSADRTPGFVSTWLHQAPRWPALLPRGTAPTCRPPEGPITGRTSPVLVREGRWGVGR
jgi:hypothetical protein